MKCEVTLPTDNLCSLLFQSSPEPVKEQILSMIQTWSIAFRKEPKYKIVQDTFNLMRMEGKKQTRTQSFLVFQ